jgi:hypothetical protein
VVDEAEVEDEEVEVVVLPRSDKPNPVKLDALKVSTP